MNYPASRFLTSLFLLIQLFVYAQQNGVYLIQSPENNLVMEVDNKRQHINGVKVYLKKPNGKNTQKWVLNQNPNGYFTLKNLSNGKMMSVLSYNLNKEGNQLILNTPDNSGLQQWRIEKTGMSEYKIANISNNQVLSPKNNSYRNAAKIVLAKSKYGKRQTWMLVPADMYSDDNDRFTGSFQNNRTGVNMEIVSAGNNRYKAYFSGKCSDESLSGSIDRTGKLVLPLASGNNARLEITYRNGNYQVMITNYGVLNRSSESCNGGLIEGTYRKRNTGNTGNFTGRYRLVNGNVDMEIRKDSRGYRAFFSGNCNAETLSGTLNRYGEIEIPLRGGYNDKLYIRKNGNRLNVRISNRNIMNRVCSGYSLEGDYVSKTNGGFDYSGRFRLDNGWQYMELVRQGNNYYKAVFTGNCKAETLSGTVNRQGILEIPLRGGYNDKLYVSRMGNRLKVSITNRNVMRNACGNYSIEGLYSRQSSNSIPQFNFSGVYRYKMQYVQLTPVGRNRYTARFFGDCILSTQNGTVNNNGVLEIPFSGSNRQERMMIRPVQGGIEIRNTSNTPVQSRCRGKTLEGRYTRS